MEKLFGVLALFLCFYCPAQKQFCGEIVYEMKDSSGSSKQIYTVFIGTNSALFVNDSSDASKVSGFTEMLLTIERGEAFVYYINKELGVALKRKHVEMCHDYIPVSQDEKENEAKYFVKSKPMISNNGNYIMEFEVTYFSNLSYYIFQTESHVKCYPAFGIIQGHLMQGSLSLITENGIKSFSRTSIKSMKETRPAPSMFELPVSLKIEEHTNDNELKYSLEYFLRHRNQ